MQETPVSAGPPEIPVRLVAGDAANGVALMTAQYLEQTLQAVPSKRAEAARLRGRLGMRASDADVAITLEFTGKEVLVHNGIDGPVEAYIAGPFQLLIQVLGGQTSPYKEVIARKIVARPSLRRPLFALQVYTLMQLGEARGPVAAIARRPWLLAVGAAGATAVIATAVVLARR